jgi:hypothetical protein
MPTDRTRTAEPMATGARVSRSAPARSALLALLAAGVAAFFLLDLGAYLTLDSLKARQAELAALVDSGRCW